MDDSAPELEQIVANLLAMDNSRVVELVNALDRVRENGFGDVVIEVRKERVTRINYVVLGKPFNVFDGKTK